MFHAFQNAKILRFLQTKPTDSFSGPVPFPFFFFPVPPMTCGSLPARGRTRATAETGATAVTMLGL